VEVVKSMRQGEPSPEATDESAMSGRAHPGFAQSTFQMARASSENLIRNHISTTCFPCRQRLLLFHCCEEVEVGLSFLRIEGV
jgi:hypothetical protein